MWWGSLCGGGREGWRGWGCCGDIADGKSEVYAIFDLEKSIIEEGAKMFCAVNEVVCGVASRALRGHGCGECI